MKFFRLQQHLLADEVGKLSISFVTFQQHWQSTAASVSQLLTTLYKLYTETTKLQAIFPATGNCPTGGDGVGKTLHSSDKRFLPLAEKLECFWQHICTAYRVTEQDNIRTTFAVMS